MADPAGGTEPIGDRIIEIADDLRALRQSRHASHLQRPCPGRKHPEGPRPGRGKAGAVACETCHGAGLKGAGNIPGIAGRSPTYTFRQLYDYKQRVRAGAASAAMMPSVQDLTVSDMLALSAYAGSLPP